MGGKYTAQWWEKIADLNREMEARHSPSQVVDDLIQATATGKAQADFASIEMSRFSGPPCAVMGARGRSGPAFVPRVRRLRSCPSGRGRRPKQERFDLPIS
jgi:hypothetical protein